MYNQTEAARALRERYGGSIILKSASSVLVAEDGEAINCFGTPAMAKAGSGDALAGILGALLAGQKEYHLHGVPGPSCKRPARCTDWPGKPPRKNAANTECSPRIYVIISTFNKSRIFL